jgi:serine/threonine protein kinase
VAGPKQLDEGAEARTAAMPMGTRKSASEEPTAALPPGQAFQIFAQPDPRSGVAGRKPEARAPLDFSGDLKIDRFEMIREIARGGMGQVFLARDTKLGRKVAIKFLLHADPEFVQRFLIEARATARCTHENIITIFEVGEHDGLPYMVLEYLEGKTLSDVLDAKPSLRHFTELIVPVVRALERAHDDGIVHRDLKPSNIFVTDRGQVKVLDFGVARLIDRAASLTEHLAAAVDPRSLRYKGEDSVSTFGGSNSLVGTLPYMSPEQWGVDVVDQLSDLWAVGVMFWRALTNVHPAGTMSPEKLRARLCDLETPLASIAERDPKIPSELAAIIDRCLMKKKAERYQSATELLADLQRFLAPSGRGDDTSPYRGLAAFGESDAKYFFGRSNEIRSALAQLDAWPLLAVIGPSGVGKSSFVHAGLVPAVRTTGGNWHVRILRPGRVPLQRLAGVLEETHATGQDGHEIVTQLAEAPGMFGDLLRKAAIRREHRVLVVVDQLEELFTLCDDDAQRRTFLAALLAAADDPASPVRVVLSMRADFLDRLAGHKQFLNELSRGLLFLTAPDLDNLRETVVRPAELAGYGFEDPEIVEDMMKAATSRGVLPLLSFAASRLWDARDRERKLLTRHAYQDMGGVVGAFAQHADQVAASVPLRSQPLLRAIMTRLVTPEGTRAVVDHAEMVSLAAAGDVEIILDQLVRARLIHLQTDPDQGATIEIVHEMLITEWPTLANWLEDSHAVRGFTHELRQAARQWDARNRPADLVWRGATGQEALANAARHVLDLSAVEREFLDAVRWQLARARRTRAMVFAAIFCAAIAVLAGGMIAVVRIRAAEQVAERKAVAAESAAELARTAQAQAQSDLAAAKAAELAKAQAEQAQQLAAAKVVRAEGEVNESREELEQKNVALESALSEAQVEKERAQVASQKAVAAAGVAKKATDEATRAKAQVEDALAKERERVKELEAEKKHIYDGDLLHRKP